MNKAKYIVVVLGRYKTMFAAHTHGLTLLQTTDTCRYLDIQVGQVDAFIINWDKCFQLVWARLSPARQKSHSVEQRALLVRAIALPKIFVRRKTLLAAKKYYKASTQACKRCCVGHAGREAEQALVPEEQDELPVKEGGLSVSCSYVWCHHVST